MANIVYTIGEALIDFVPLEKGKTRLRWLHSSWRTRKKYYRYYKI